MGNDTTTKLSIVIDAENKTDAAFKDVNNQMKAFKDVAKGMAVAGTVAFAAISAEIYKSVEAFAESEKQMAQVDSTINTFSKKTLDTFGGSIEDAQKKARAFGAEMQAMGGIGDEIASIGFVKLVQSTNDYTKATEAAKVAADLATYGQLDYLTAVKLVQQVLAGNTGALSRYGIVVEKGATAEQALAAIAQTTAGQYESFGKTIAGQTKILSETFGDLQENIGKGLAPILTDLLSKVSPVLNKFVEWTGKNPELTRNILLVSLAVAGLVAGLGTLGVVMPAIVAGASAIGVAFGLISLPVLAVIALLAVIGTSIYFIVKNWKGAMEQLGIIWGNFKKGFMEGINTMIKGFQPLVDLFNMIVDGWKGIFGVLGKIGSTVGSVVKSGLDMIPGGVSQPISTPASFGPLAPKTGTSYQFNFNGDVNDKDALMKNIKSMLDRSASLVQIGA